MSQNAIIPLLKEFREQKISATELHDKLESVVQFCERKQANLGKVRILAQDLEEWQSTLMPALELSFKGLIGAAKMGQEYAKNPSQEIAEAIVYAFIQVDKATQFVEQRLQGVSKETQNLVQQEVNDLPRDASDVQALEQGHAQTVASLFND